MALLRARNLDHPPSDEVTIPDPRSLDPNYRAAVELLNAFSARHDRLSQERLRLTFEVHFSTRSAENDDSTDRQLRDKLKALRALPPLRPAPTETPAVSSAAITQGIKILAGEALTAEPSFGARIAALDGQLAALSAAISEQTETVHQLHGEVSLRIAEQLLPKWNAALRDVYEHALELSRAAARFRKLRNAVISAGIRSELLKAPMTHTLALSLGDEGNQSSMIAEWRKTLQTWGAL